MTNITDHQLHTLFGKDIPEAAWQILNDASDDRTLEDVIRELESLAAQIKEANRA